MDIYVVVTKGYYNQEVLDIHLFKSKDAAKKYQDNVCKTGYDARIYLRNLDDE